MAKSFKTAITLAEVKASFRETLDPVYGPREAQSLTDLCLGELLSLSRLEQHSQSERVIPASKRKELERILSGLEHQQPVQYLLGYTWFMGLKLKTDKRALIPRPETEELVAKIAARTKLTSPSILDVGTGSGAIALGLKSKLTGAVVYAADISKAALKLAAENAALTQLEIHTIHLDVLNESLQKIPVDGWDIIVSNPPYVTLSEKPRMLENVVGHEPHLALFVSDEDPLVFYRTIAAQAQRYLNRQGWLFFEINEKYGNEVAEILAQMNFTNVIIEKDLSGRNRFVSACK